MTDNNNEVQSIPQRSKHTFHIPVMGVGFTIDTPLKVARYGISSVISLVDDVLIEQMRKFHSEKEGEPYEEISNKDDDARARRITEYLNLMDKMVDRQVKKLQSSPFEEKSEITKYYEMLPDSPLKQSYNDMLATKDESEKIRMQADLRDRAVPGSIDVNIMTKLDRPKYKDGQKQERHFSDALSGLRGFAQSTVAAAVVFSAGMNQHLYTYAAEFKDFFSDAKDKMKKTIVLKVSDYRSALIQGKFLAKRGLWVSEFRIESGLNCGGHAFATQGHLMGPILEEFKKNRKKLQELLHGAYNKARVAAGLKPIESPRDMKITVQGGLGTVEEDKFLMNHYELDGTGWATPFLLAPEVANVDDDLLKQLSSAREEDVYLSESSPMGTPFWNLKDSPSEVARENRISQGKPGSPCTKRYIAIDSEFSGMPLCKGARSYQKQKLEQIENQDLDGARKKSLIEDVLAKSCICHDLGGSVKLKHGIENDATPAICPGPNLAYFSKIVDLEEMVSHIYGRLSLLADSARAHMFIQELRVYIEHLCKETEKLSMGLSVRTEKYLNEFKENLLNGIDYYRNLASKFVDGQQDRFISDLDALYSELKSIVPVATPEASSVPSQL